LNLLNKENLLKNILSIFFIFVYLTILNKINPILN
jgi:hypothetical protein